MAIVDGFQQHEIRDLSTAEENISTGESTPLMGNEERITCARMQLKFRCRHHRCCLTSKAAILILLWNLILVAGLESFLDHSFFGITFGVLDSYRVTYLSVTMYSVVAFLFLFYPLAGCLADICWGRHKTVINSLRVIWGSLVAMVVFGSVGTVSLTIPMFLINSQDFPLNTVKIITIVLVSVVFGIPTLIAFLLVPCGIVCFSANVIQYGVDQLHDAPTDDSILYIHWYVWTSFAALLPMKLGINVLGGNFIIFSPVFIILPLLLLGVTLCIHRSKRHWFFIDSGSRNPYKLVYKVLKFAKDHTNPVRRSAFTYCEDELPSRLDLGKEKYGGPFTTEQVEDVKAFLGILCVLLTLGPILMVDFSMSGILWRFASHLDRRLLESLVDTDFEHGFKVGSLTPFMITILIPFYLCLLRPFFQKCTCIPGMLKRIGLGMTLILLSNLCTSAMDAYGHRYANVTVCFLNNDPFVDYHRGHLFTLNINSYSLVTQYFLNAVGYMLLYIAVYEFVCSQSPHAMKGLVIGTFFAIKGVFQLLGVAITYVPIAFGWNIVRIFPSCGFVYYLINATIVLIGIVAYTCVARHYQYRERDEPDNIYRYAEEYYAS